MLLIAVADWTILAAMGVLLLWFAFARQGRRRNKSSDGAVSRPASASLTADGRKLDTPASVAQWEVSMHETARDLMGRLDTKIVIVEQLVRDARESADRIEKLLDQLEKASQRCNPTGSDALEANDPKKANS
jgi:hypothetical protein